MKTIVSSGFIVWEGVTYRIDRIAGDGFDVLVLKGGTWVPASGKLGATILFEGKEVSNPTP